MNALTTHVFVAWQDRASQMTWPVGRLLRLPAREPWEFGYVGGAADAATHGFTPFVEFPDLRGTYRSPNLFPFFLNRLMRKSRPDFPDYLKRLALGETAGPLLILARSEGVRVTDRFEIFAPPFRDPSNARLTYFFFLRGVRDIHGAEDVLSGIRAGQELEWKVEPENDADRRAVVVLAGRNVKVGYAPPVLVEDLRAVLDAGCDFRIFVERGNPPPAPVQQRLLCRLDLDPPAGFAPFGTSRYAPLAPDATPIGSLPVQMHA